MMLLKQNLRHTMCNNSCSIWRPTRAAQSADGIGIDQQQADAFVAGATYSLLPINRGEEHRWGVREVKLLP